MVQRVAKPSIRSSHTCVKGRMAPTRSNDSLSPTATPCLTSRSSTKSSTSEFKGRFAQWYNRRHGRYGVLWADRFKSVLLEGGEALAAVAAYIELNPVRAGLCADPKDYRYCGYAEALAKGSSLARQGIKIVLGHSDAISWKEVSEQYRKYLFVHGVVDQQNGELSLPERLRC